MLELVKKTKEAKLNSKCDSRNQHVQATASDEAERTLKQN